MSRRRRRFGTEYEFLDEGTPRWSAGEKREAVAARKGAAERGDSGWVRSGGRLSSREFLEFVEGKQAAFTVFTMCHMLESLRQKATTRGGTVEPPSRCPEDLDFIEASAP